MLEPGVRMRTDGGATFTVLHPLPRDPMWGWRRWLVRADWGAGFDVHEHYLAGSCRPLLTVVGATDA